MPLIASASTPESAPKPIAATITIAQTSELTERSTFSTKRTA